MAGCVFGYFADCTVVMPLFLRIANAFVPKCGRRNAEVQVVMSIGFITVLALAEEPTFHNVFRLPVNRSVPKNKVTLINKQTSSIWPFSSLTWCCALLLHKCVFRTQAKVSMYIESSFTCKLLK